MEYETMRIGYFEPIGATDSHDLLEKVKAFIRVEPRRMRMEEVVTVGRGRRHEKDDDDWTPPCGATACIAGTMRIIVGGLQGIARELPTFLPVGIGLGHHREDALFGAHRLLPAGPEALIVDAMNLFNSFPLRGRIPGNRIIPYFPTPEAYAAEVIRLIDNFQATWTAELKAHSLVGVLPDEERRLA